MSSDPKPVGGQWHKAARGELSPPKGASEETLVPQLFTASVPDPRTVQFVAWCLCPVCAASLEHLECSHQPHIQGRGAQKRTQRAG